eukprot:3307909-Rhodomonas_salina.4
MDVDGSEAGSGSKPTDHTSLGSQDEQQQQQHDRKKVSFDPAAAAANEEASSREVLIDALHQLVAKHAARTDTTQQSPAEPRPDAEDELDQSKVFLSLSRRPTPPSSLVGSFSASQTMSGTNTGFPHAPLPCIHTPLSRHKSMRDVGAGAHGCMGGRTWAVSKLTCVRVCAARAGGVR